MRTDRTEKRGRRKNGRNRERGRKRETIGRIRSV